MFATKCSSFIIFVTRWSETKAEICEMQMLGVFPAGFKACFLLGCIVLGRERPQASVVVSRANVNDIMQCRHSLCSMLRSCERVG